MIKKTPSSAAIIDRGRGPEIAGTRITVYDVFDYYKHGWHPARIANLFRISTTEILAAIDYIESHSDDVTEGYEKIQSRQQSIDYPEDIRAAVNKCRQNAERRLAEIRRHSSGN